MTRFIKTRMDKKKGSENATKKSSQKENPDHVPDIRKKVCNYYKCGKDAIGNYTTDLDVRGLNFCKKHKSDISSAVLWAVLGIQELAEQAMGFPQPKKKKQR